MDFKIIDEGTKLATPLMGILLVIKLYYQINYTHMAEPPGFLLGKECSLAKGIF
jgi:hypothetical protein